MAKLVSMKQSKSDRDAQLEGSIASDQPAYPYGLSINLDDATLKKLGLDADDLKAGDELGLVAHVEVTSLSSHDSVGGGKSQNLTLQITECCIEEHIGDAAKALYKE